MNLVIYNATGRILRSVQCPESLAALQCRDGERALEGTADDAREYVTDGEITPRPAMPVTLVVAGLTAALTLPDPCSLIVQGARHEVIGGAAELVLELPGAYPVRVEAWPYLDYETVIEVA